MNVRTIRGYSGASTRFVATPTTYGARAVRAPAGVTNSRRGTSRGTMEDPDAGNRSAVSFIRWRRGESVDVDGLGHRSQRWRNIKLTKRWGDSWGRLLYDDVIWIERGRSRTSGVVRGAGCRN